LGLLTILENALQVDRAGSAVLEELLVKQHADDAKELIVTT
jgi:hypothetical protein